MDDFSMLLSKNKVPPYNRVLIKNSCFIYKHNQKLVDFTSYNRIFRFLTTIMTKYRGARLPIIFDLGTARFIDKLTYILFECICYTLIVKYNYRVQLIGGKHHYITTAGVESSPLEHLTMGQFYDLEKFKSQFRFNIFGNHYRRYLTREHFSKPEMLSQILDDIANFQNLFNIAPDCREAIAEVIIELIGNASEHGSSNCLVDFDISPPYTKSITGGRYRGINIAITNFSDNLLGTALKDKLSATSFYDDRYSLVKDAHFNHKQFFDESYTEEDFFNITAFQHKISGRNDKIITGGTGLTKLIKTLEKRSDAHVCYMITGNRGLIFKPEYLEYNKDGWIGFNDTNDYLNCRPHKEIISENYFFMPGTAYNLCFILQEENENG